MALIISSSDADKSAMIFEESAGGVPKREVGKIEVSFTARVFPTPVRESQTPQEEEVCQLV